MPDASAALSMLRHEDVLAAAARGDDEALALLVRAYHDRIYRFGLRVCRDGFDADDAVQAAFTKLSQRSDVQRDRGALSWLMSVVRNECRRMLGFFARERRALGERMQESELAADQVDAQQALERWELVQAVHAAITRLAPSYREVLVMRDLEGLTGDEAARALGIEPAAMKTRLHRAREQLRDELTKNRTPRSTR